MTARRMGYRGAGRAGSPASRGAYVRLLAAAFLTASLISGVLAAPGASSAQPACFGAAARDPAHRCSNSRLRLSVSPTPAEAVLVPNAPCTPLEPALNVCGFGVPAAPGVKEISLIGNSHAGHWRAALEVVAEAMGWQGVSITRSSCPFVQATISLPEPKRAQCTRWVQGIPAWFAQHPEVSTVFVSDQPTPPIVAPGHSALAAEVGGNIAAWNALPPSVKHIVVIRDNPYTHGDVLACVEAAMARREPAGPRCAVPRNLALKADPAAIAAQQLRSPRVQVIDLTNFFCDSRTCPPVIGGALVYRDSTHLTRVFAITLGPYLLQEVRKLVASWGEG